MSAAICKPGYRIDRPFVRTPLISTSARDHTERFPIDLAITVGHPVMIGIGPLGGHAVETGLVIASTDPLAADVVSAQLLGFSPQAVRHLWEAERLGLGISDKEQMQFPAMSLKQAVEAFTLAAYGEALLFG